MSGLRITVNTQNIETALQRKLKKLVTDNKTRRGVNEIIADAANKYVPNDTGYLAENVSVGPKTISYTADYAKYQYEGEVYGPNYPVFEGQLLVDWKPASSIGPTGRTLGTPGFFYKNGQVVWQFGYTTPGTRHHWIALMWDNDSRRTNIRITNWLKQRAKEKGL